MKQIWMGDTHGRSFWKLISQREKWDLFGFIGDYFDTKEDISPAEQMYNFKEICSFIEEDPENRKGLIGNHDYHYLRGVHETYSGYQPGNAYSFQILLEEALDKKLLQACYVHGKFCFTHAGITNTWLENQGYKPRKMSEKRDLENFVNDIFFYKRAAFGFSPGRMSDHYGDTITQTPIWVRPAPLSEDKVSRYTHVVGHTQVSGVKLDINGTGMILIDALGASEPQYLVIEDGIPRVEKI